MMKPSSRRGGLAAVVLGSAIGVGSMSGCGAAILGGAAYLAAEEIAQSNVEAARIRADNGQERQTKIASRIEEMRKNHEQLAAQLEELLKPKVFACNYIDNSLDGDASSVSEQDVIGRRSSMPALFRDDEPICFSGFSLRDYFGKKTAVKLINEEGSTIARNEYVVDHSNGVLSGFQFKPGRLSQGHYKFVWYLDDTFVGSVDAEVRSKSSVLTQK